jgi:hypothetical protein
MAEDFAVAIDKLHSGVAEDIARASLKLSKNILTHLEHSATFRRHEL